MCPDVSNLMMVACQVLIKSNFHQFSDCLVPQWLRNMFLQQLVPDEGRRKGTDDGGSELVGSASLNFEAIHQNSHKTPSPQWNLKH